MQAVSALSSQHFPVFDWKATMENQLLDETTETELLHQAKSGDFAAFQKTFRQASAASLWPDISYSQQAQDAEDATSNLSGVDRAYRRLSRRVIRRDWVLRIATNNALKILRKKANGEDGFDVGNDIRR